jgi:ADP-heptose:LPS heptosyltransferase
MSVRENLATEIVIIGQGDQRRLIQSPGVVDLGKEIMPIEETAGLLSIALLYIGGDSGPTHLAGSVGCPILGVGYITERFGPFVPAPKLLGLYGETAVGNIRKVDLVELTELIAQFLALDEGRYRSPARGEIS